MKDKGKLIHNSVVELCMDAFSHEKQNMLLVMMVAANDLLDMLDR